MFCEQTGLVLIVSDYELACHELDHDFRMFWERIWEPHIVTELKKLAQPSKAVPADGADAEPEGLSGYRALWDALLPGGATSTLR